MSGILPVSATSSMAIQDTASTGSDAQLADAFAQGIIQFMGLIIQNGESDIQDSVNDTTSDPDAPS